MTAADTMAVDSSAAPAAAAAAAEPQKPKRAASAYWLFSNAVREELTKASKEKNDGKAKLGDIAKEVAAKWAALPEAEKKVYEDKAAVDKTRYETESQAYKDACDPAAALRRKYQDKIPKKPLTAYFLFSQDPAMREKATEALKAAGQETGNKQLAAKLGELWKAAAAEEKAPFEEQNKKEMADFLEKQKAWQATPEFAEIEKAEKVQEERRKAAEAEQQAAEAKDKAEKEAKSAKKRSRSEAKQEQTPKGKAKEAKGKEAKKPNTTPASDVKRPKKVAKTEPAPPQIDADVLAEAAKLGYEGVLKNLAARPEVAASGKSHRALLDALQASQGLVNPAKRALLGA